MNKKIINGLAIGLIFLSVITILLFLSAIANNFNQLISLEIEQIRVSTYRMDTALLFNYSYKINNVYLPHIRFAVLTIIISFIVIILNINKDRKSA